MKIYRENDVIYLRYSVTAEVIGEARSLVVPVGTAGVIVLAHGNPLAPAAYEVEFHMKDQDCSALATIEANNI